MAILSQLESPCVNTIATFSWQQSCNRNRLVWRGSYSRSNFPSCSSSLSRFCSHSSFDARSSSLSLSLSPAVVLAFSCHSSHLCVSIYLVSLSRLVLSLLSTSRVVSFYLSICLFLASVSSSLFLISRTSLRLSHMHLSISLSLRFVWKNVNINNICLVY